MWLPSRNTLGPLAATRNHTRAQLTGRLTSQKPLAAVASADACRMQCGRHQQGCCLAVWVCLRAGCQAGVLTTEVLMSSAAWQSPVEALFLDKNLVENGTLGSSSLTCSRWPSPWS